MITFSIWIESRVIPIINYEIFVNYTSYFLYVTRILLSNQLKKQKCANKYLLLLMINIYANSNLIVSIFNK